MIDETWVRIGRFDSAKRRSIWAKQLDKDTIEIRGGREGDDSSVTLFRWADPIFDTVEAQLWALEMDNAL